MNEGNPAEQPQITTRRLVASLGRLLIPAVITTAVLATGVLVVVHRHIARPPAPTAKPVSSTPSTDHHARVVPAVRVPVAVLARLPRATTDERVAGAPIDPAPYARTTGAVAHPTRTIPVYAAPGGLAVAALTPTQMGDSPTWLPVITTRPGWLAVLLPTRPNHSTGWITTGAVEQAHTDYTIGIALGAHRLTLYWNGHPVGAWPISAGKPSTPTPTGRTFLLAEINDTRTHYSPVTWPLGTHSTSLDTFDGGPGTVAIHGWPDPAVFGHDHSSGCVRIPAAGLRALATVPLGSLVTITH